MASCNKSKATSLLNVAKVSNAKSASKYAVNNESTAGQIATANKSEKVSKETADGKDCASQIAVANKNGKAIFLVVFDKKGADKEKAIGIAKKALIKKSNSAKIVELNTTEASNTGLVSKFRLTGAPLPLIIVIDKNGVPVGGLLLSEATPEKLSEMIPSPKYSEVLKALNDKKSVFIVAYKETMVEKNKAIANCISAAKAMNNGATVVLLKIDNKAEKSLIENLRINTIATRPAIYAINKSGQITGTFTPEANVVQLTKAANKVASGCGSGCASGCNQ